MNNFTTHRLNEDNISQSSDEKMDTGSESFISTQNTPNSILSSDFEDRDQSLDQNNVLRLQNPEKNDSTSVLRLSEPEKNDNIKTTVSKFKEDLSNSFVSKMSRLQIESPIKENSINRPKNLGISPPRLSSTLTLATNHPLMGLGSPDGNYPDLIPEKLPKNEDERDLSLSSIEDERQVTESNGYDFFPQRNTSKNNLYFTENFVTADSKILSNLNITSPPDFGRVTEQITERRKIKPRLSETPQKDPSTPPWDYGVKDDGHSVANHLGERNRDVARVQYQSTPKNALKVGIEIPESELLQSGVADWCESPSHLRSMPNFELPIELTTDIVARKGIESPDVISSSTQEDRSAYQALLDPYTGSVALTHKPGRSPSDQRRKIQLPPEEDRCSIYSVSACSMESEDEPPDPEPCADENPDLPSDDEDTKQSTNTLSESSEPIPEYSAAEELREERSWLTVPRGQGGHAVCDMKVIEPYKRVLSHGGYDVVGAAVIVFSACHLPDKARPDYHYVMDNLFLYVIWTVERLITDEYVLVYLHGSAGSRRLPNFHWLHECYKLIDRRLRKSLKHLYLVHPTFWLRSFVLLTKPFVSSKFFRKISYIRSLNELYESVPVEPNAIPEMVKQYDATKR